MEKVVLYHQKNPKHTIKTLKSRFKELKDYSQLHRWKKYVEQKGRRSDKLKEINNAVFEKYRCARNMFHPIRDLDLQRWATQKARQINFEFAGSPHWVYNFKKMYGIVSRKVSRKKVLHSKVYEFIVIQFLAKIFFINFYIFEMSVKV